MRVAFDCERMKYAYTGLFEYCRRLGNALLEEKPHDSEVSLYLRKENKSFFHPEAAYIQQRSIHKLFFPSCQNIDIWNTTFQASSYIPKSSRVRKVLTIHDLNFLYEKQDFAKAASYIKKYQANLNKVDHIIAISEFTKQDILKHLDTKGKPVTVIYNGCDTAEFPDYISKSYTSSNPFLFTIGTVNKKKNFHVLPVLLKDNDYNLVIAGKTDAQYVNQIYDEAKKHGVADRVQVIGAISDEDKYWYLKNCTSFLFPSIAEGFGLPVIEAMKFGKPVFLAKTTSLPEIGGSLAYYFENYDEDSMLTVFKEGMVHYNSTDPSVAIMQHAQQFNWNLSAKAYWDVYKSLM